MVMNVNVYDLKSVSLTSLYSVHVIDIPMKAKEHSVKPRFIKENQGEPSETELQRDMEQNNDTLSATKILAD